MFLELMYVQVLRRMLTRSLLLFFCFFCLVSIVVAGVVAAGVFVVDDGNSDHKTGAEKKHIYIYIYDVPLEAVLLHFEVYVLHYQ